MQFTAIHTGHYTTSSCHRNREILRGRSALCFGPRLFCFDVSCDLYRCCRTSPTGRNSGLCACGAFVQIYLRPASIIKMAICANNSSNNNNNGGNAVSFQNTMITE